VEIQIDTYLELITFACRSRRCLLPPTVLPQALRPASVRRSTPHLLSRLLRRVRHRRRNPALCLPALPLVGPADNGSTPPLTRSPAIKGALKVHYTAPDVSPSPKGPRSKTNQFGPRTRSKTSTSPARRSTSLLYAKLVKTSTTKMTGKRGRPNQLNQPHKMDLTVPEVPLAP
jgi:hypothetical protein